MSLTLDRLYPSNTRDQPVWGRLRKGISKEIYRSCLPLTLPLQLHTLRSHTKHEDGPEAEFDAPMKNSSNTKAEYPTMVGTTSNNPRTQDEFPAVWGEK